MQIAQNLSLFSLLRRREVYKKLGGSAVVRAVRKVQPEQFLKVVTDTLVDWDIIIFAGDQIVPPFPKVVLRIQDLLGGQ